MKNPNKNASPYMGSVKVGPKGQIVIPKEVRDMFGIEPGDSLILLAHPKKGIAMERPSLFSAMADAIFAGKASEVLQPDTEDDPDNLEKFANTLKDTLLQMEEGDSE